MFLHFNPFTVILRVLLNLILGKKEEFNYVSTTTPQR